MVPFYVMFRKPAVFLSLDIHGNLAVSVYPGITVSRDKLPPVFKVKLTFESNFDTAVPIWDI